MSGKQEIVAPKIVDLSDGGQMSAMPDYVLKHMPKKWHSKMCQCCWREESEVAICMGCVDDLMGAADVSGDTEPYSDAEHGMSQEGQEAYANAAADYHPGSPAPSQ